jgi:hypothetical protein
MGKLSGATAYADVHCGSADASCAPSADIARESIAVQAKQ